MLNNPNLQQLDWQKVNQLIPAIIQHQDSGQVLMLGYMNPEALQATISSGKVTFFSRSKQRLWVKGESSANHLLVQSIHADCDNDSLLILALPAGPTCHLGTTSCFAQAKTNQRFLYELEQIIRARKAQPNANSYTAQLFASGSKRMAQKVGEEGVEVALAAATNNNAELCNESADLLFHLLVLLQQQGLNLATVIQCLEQRHQPTP